MPKVEPPKRDQDRRSGIGLTDACRPARRRNRPGNPGRAAHEAGPAHPPMPPQAPRDKKPHRQGRRRTAHYAAVRQSLGEPDPFRLLYKAKLRALVRKVITGGMGRKQAVATILSWSNEHIPPMDRQAFIGIVEKALVGLHEANFTRRQIRPSEFSAWQKAWQAS